MNKEPQIERVHTPCKNCIFATYEGNTQIGCSIYELDYYRKQGAEILEVYDKDKEFFVINNRRCIFLRDYNWAKDKSQPYTYYIHKEIEMKYQAIIVADNSFEDIKKTIKSLIDQDLPPIHISVIRPKHSSIRPRKIAELLQETGVEWRVENMMNPQHSIEHHIDIIISFVPKPHYVVFQAGFIVPKHTFNHINHSILYHNFPYLALLPNSTNNGFLTSRYIHQLFQGNKDFSLIEKLRQHEKCSQLIKPINQVIEDFPE